MRALLVVLLLCPALLLAQARRAVQLAPASDKLVTVHVKGSTRFTPEEIIAASGLKLGDSISDKVLNAVTARLGETGAFKEVAFTYSSTPKGTTVDWQITDGDQFVRARFDNVVWFAEKDLVSKVHAQVSLFKGELPLGGNLADQVKAALQQLLAARVPNAVVEYVREAELNGPIRAITYRVQGVPIHIRNVNFAGADATFAPLLQTATKPLLQEDYLAEKTSVFARLTFVPIYLERGFLKIAFGEPEIQLLQDTPQGATIDITLPVSPGLQYRLAEVTWTGNTAYPPSELGKMLHLVPGQPVNSPQLEEDLLSIGKIYGTKGYLAAHVQPSPVFHDEQASVSYTLQVTEGDVYHFRRVEIQGGLDNPTVARLLERWKLKPGDVYDNSYPVLFFQEVVRAGMLGHMRWNMSVHQTPEPREKTVDVVLRLTPAK